MLWQTAEVHNTPLEAHLLKLDNHTQPDDQYLARQIRVYGVPMCATAAGQLQKHDAWHCTVSSQQYFVPQFRRLH